MDKFPLLLTMQWYPTLENVGKWQFLFPQYNINRPNNVYCILVRSIADVNWVSGGWRPPSGIIHSVNDEDQWIYWQILLRRRDVTEQKCERSKLDKYNLVDFRVSTDLERAHESLVHWHHSTSVVELSAVIGRREERH